jgi:hypothetical protein
VTAVKLIARCFFLTIFFSSSSRKLDGDSVKSFLVSFPSAREPAVLSIRCLQTRKDFYTSMHSLKMLSFVRRTWAAFWASAFWVPPLHSCSFSFLGLALRLACWRFFKRACCELKQQVKQIYKQINEQIKKKPKKIIKYIAHKKNLKKNRFSKNVNINKTILFFASRYYVIKYKWANIVYNNLFALLFVIIVQVSPKIHQNAEPYLTHRTERWQPIKK